jgi:hypothetical protein
MHDSHASRIDLHFELRSRAMRAREHAIGIRSRHPHATIFAASPPRFRYVEDVDRMG